MGAHSCSNYNEEKENSIETISKIVLLQRHWRRMQREDKDKNKLNKDKSKGKDEEIVVKANNSLDNIANEVFNIDLKTIKLSIIEEIEAKVGEYHLNPIEKNPNLVYKELLYKDDSVYLGTINKLTSKREGNGILYYPDRSKYIGSFLHNEPHGKGRIIYPDGALYEGTFKEGIIHGYGKYSYQNYLYIGNWKNELKEGYGEEFYEDGLIFKGSYILDKKNGIGKLIWPNDRVYEGNFSDNAIHGIGKMLWPDDKISVGNWNKGVIEGITIFYWPDDQRYIGEYSSFQKNGFGIFYWDKNKVYQGTWVNGKQHGYGLIKDSLGLGSASLSASEIYVSEYRFGIEINQIASNNEMYAAILKEINEKTIAIEAYVMKEFNIEGIEDIAFHKKMIQFQVYS